MDKEFFNGCLDKTLVSRQEGDTVIVMSHRPSAFDFTAPRNVSLTLAGHTHGGQVGFMGRSILESSFPESYLWGHYRSGSSHLYTTSGMGHWFPFRLGCPPEAPVIELTRA